MNAASRMFSVVIFYVVLMAMTSILFGVLSVRNFLLADELTFRSAMFVTVRR
jgi:hypothetical protein